MFRKEQVNNILLSNTSHGRSWLSQFAEEDQEVARLLLNDLLFISNTQLIIGLKELIIEFLKNQARGKVALFAAREKQVRRIIGVMICGP